MKREQRYGIKSLAKDFPNDDVCLDFLFDAQHTRQCSCGGSYKRIAGRKQYQCSKCRFQIAPTAGTIFHKSDTPLTVWFAAILSFSSSKSGKSAKELERELEVTYKTAWRMLHLIRKALGQNNGKLKGIVEMDTGYLGGISNRTKGVMKNKTVVMAAKERGGNIRAQVVADSTAQAHREFLAEYVEPASFLMTDQTNRLEKAAKGYERHTVNHSKGEHVRGAVHVNNIEAFFAHVKRSVKGTHKIISRESQNSSTVHYSHQTQKEHVQ